MEQKMVEVRNLPGSHVRMGGRRGVVQKLLRDGPPERPVIVCLVYWHGGLMSFEYDKALEAA